MQLPAWNEALGLPRPWDQQWSLRIQQIVAFETDLLEYGDIFDGSTEIARKVEELKAEAAAEMQRIADMGGAVAAIESAYMKQRLVESNLKRLAAIEAGEQTVVGVNAYTEAEPLAAVGRRRRHPDRRCVGRARADRAARGVAGEPRCRRGGGGAGRARGGGQGGTQRHARLDRLRGRGRHDRRMDRRVARGLRRISCADRRGPGDRRERRRLEVARREVEAVSRRLGRRIKMLVGKPGLDGHSNGAEQIAVRARDCGLEVVYEGIRLTPEQIVNAALEESVHVVGLSILSGGHVSLVAEVLEGLRAAGIGDVPVVVGGIIPPADADALIEAGVARVYTPKDFDLTQIVRDIVAVVDSAWKEAA